MTFKKLGGLLMKTVLFVSYFLAQKNWPVSLLAEFIYIQLKYHRHRIRSKIGFSLEIILNVFKCLTPSRHLLAQS